MSDCLYHAYTSHLRALHKIPVSHASFCYWRRAWQGHDGNVEMVYVYPLLREMSYIDRALFRMQTIYPLSEMLKFAELQAGYWQTELLERIYNKAMWISAYNPVQIVPKINLQPAIYGLLTQQHAVYLSQTPREGFPVFAVQYLGE